MVDSMCASIGNFPRRSPALPRKQRMAVAPMIFATRKPRTMLLAGSPLFALKLPEVGQMQPMPASIAMPSRSAWSLTFLRYAGSRLSYSPMLEI